MKRAIRTMAAAGVFASAGFAPGAGAQTGVPPVERLAGAKAIFEQACGVCHGLERPLSKTFDRAGWEATVERMHGNGAEVDRAERAQVVAYLFTKNLFEAKCSICHPVDRPLGASKSAPDWLATAQRMSEKKPGHLTADEVADIAAYLAVTRPEAK
jgi:mono/diheme cytochrome c family protein